MLPSTARNITCDTDIKAAITLAGEDIDARALLTHAAIDHPLFMAGAGSGSPLSRGRREFVVPSERGDTEARWVRHTLIYVTTY